MLNSARKWIGEAAHTLALARLLQTHGHPVVLAARKGHELERRAQEAGLEVRALHMGSRFHPLRDLADARAIAAIARSEHIDILHANRGKDHWLAAAARLLMRRPPPLVRTRHVVTPAATHPFNRWLYRYATHGLYSVSQAAHDSLGPLARLVPGPQAVILSAVDTERFTPERRDPAMRGEMGVAHHDLLVVCVGRFQRVKGHRYLVRAAAQAVRNGAPLHLVVAGRSSERQRARLAQEARLAGLPEGRLSLMGWVEDLPRLLASADIGVVASVGSEGSSRAALEYMASGLAVVATRVGGLPELVRPDIGRLVAPRNAQALAQAIDAIAADAQAREKMGQAARALAKSDFNYARWLRETKEFYQDVQRR